MDHNTDRHTIFSWMQGLQDEICSGLEELDGKASFEEDIWTREDGGGGRSRVILGRHIEKGGVMWSGIEGMIPETIAKGLGIDPVHFHATGVSIVLHPKSPWVPIIHMNVRYFETSKGLWWFGGGIDVTPHYINDTEAQAFHGTLKSACEELGPEVYQEYKAWADDYFYIPHRQETRGIGGIFYDRLNHEKGYSKEACWSFTKVIGSSFMKCYTPLFLANYERPYQEQHKNWQRVRRGRYVEFNLVYDRGTKFGLQTNGRIESILMSMPPQADWLYNYQPAAGSAEAITQSKLRKGIDWIKDTEVSQGRL